MNITNDLVTEYINSFYEPVTDELADLRLSAEKRKVPIILKETENFLTFFLRLLKPERILEIGTAVGYSSSVFAAVCDAKICTIEKDIEMAGIAHTNIRALGYDKRIEVFTGDGEEIINVLLNQGEKPFDFVFIDAAKSHYKRFLDAALSLCKEGTIIISDNVLFKARTASDIYDENGKYKTNIRKMREYLAYINSDSRFDTTVIACGDGLAITRIK